MSPPPAPPVMVRSRRSTTSRYSSCIRFRRSLNLRTHDGGGHTIHTV